MHRIGDAFFLTIYIALLPKGACVSIRLGFEHDTSRLLAKLSSKYFEISKNRIFIFLKKKKNLAFFFEIMSKNNNLVDIFIAI